MGCGRRADPSAARDADRAGLTAPSAADPCLDKPVRPALHDGRRIRVLELLATGTNGGAQQHVDSLLSRIDRSRYDPLVVSLGDGSAVRRIRATGQEVVVIAEAEDSRAVAALV